MLNAEAQRGSPDRVTAPFLVWQFAAWQGPPDNPKELEDVRKGERRYRKWVEDLNEVIARLVGPHHGFRILPAPIEGKKAVGEVYLENETMFFEGLLANPAISMRVALHSEHVRFAFALPVVDPFDLESPNAPFVLEDDLSSSLNARTGPSPKRFSSQPLSVTDPHVDRIVKEVAADIIRKDNESDESYLRRSAVAWDKLYDDAWAEAFRGYPAPIDVPGEVFASFRGVVLSRNWLIGAAGETELETLRCSGKCFVDTDLTDLPEVDPEQDYEGEEPPRTPNRWNRISAGRSLEKNTGLRHALHWPGGIVPDDQKLEPTFHRRTIANLLIDGRTLYASTLAAAVPRSFGSQERDVLARNSLATSRYALFYCPEESSNAQMALSRRLDRLVLRLADLGTLRLLALKDLQRIKAARIRLRNLLGEMTARGIRGLSHGYLKKIYRRSQEINQLCIGTLSERVRKSARYVAEFENRLPDLGSYRIEGWEPYPEFVRRRLTQSYAAIQQVAPLQQEVQSRIDQLTAFMNAKSDGRIQRSILILTIVMICVGMLPLWLWYAEQSRGSAARQVEADPPQGVIEGPD